jgi:hypothetical protein
VPLVLGPLRVTTATIRAGDLRCHASPCQDIAPSGVAWVLALLQPASLRSPAPHRPDVSLSWAFPPAFAAAGILLPSGLRLAPPLGPEGHWRVTPFPLSLARTLQVTLAPGCRDGAPGAVRGRPASSPLPWWLQRYRLWRWVTLTRAPPRLRFRYPSGPARRDGRLEASCYRRFPPLPPVENQARAGGVCWPLGP